MLSEKDLDMIEGISPILGDYLLVSINEGVQSMLDIIVQNEGNYEEFFKSLDTFEAKEMLSFINEVALPFYTKREMFEYSTKCKKISDLITKYKG